MEKKAISGIITAVVMIALVMAVSSIVWVVVNNLVKDKLDEAGSCFNIFEKVTINSRYTCYNITQSNSGDPNELRFPINIADIELTGILVSISNKEGNSKSFKLSKTGLTEDYVRLYSDNGYTNQDILLPGKNSGTTFVIDLDSTGIGIPSSIQIAPIVNERQCEVSDSLQFIDNCMALVN